MANLQSLQNPYCHNTWWYSCADLSDMITTVLQEVTSLQHECARLFDDLWYDNSFSNPCAIGKRKSRRKKKIQMLVERHISWEDPIFQCPGRCSLSGVLLFSQIWRWILTSTAGFPAPPGEQSNASNTSFNIILGMSILWSWASFVLFFVVRCLWRTIVASF